MNDKRYVKPRGFENYVIAEVCAPGEDWTRHYDIENEIIWINTAAETANNVDKVSPCKW